jgi:hypothetical protein
MALQQSAFAKQQEKIAHLQKFIARFKAKASKAKQAQSRVKALDRMEKIAPLLAESRALAVWHDGKLYLPTFQFLEMKTFGQEAPAGWDGNEIETEYFRLQREWRVERQMHARDIRAAGAKAGLSIKPGTPLEPYLGILRDFDTLLVMSVEPGFGGQSFIPEVLSKVSAARRLVDAGELTILIEIDGGINADTIEQAAEAGVDCFVAGSAVYGAEDPAAAVQALRRQAGAASPHLRV